MNANIDKIRAALGDSSPVQRTAARSALAELETEVSQLRARVGPIESTALLQLIAERDQLRTRLAEIEKAPTVAKVVTRYGPDEFPCGTTIQVEKLQAGTERMVPVEATAEMAEAVHYGPNSADEPPTLNDIQFWQECWTTMLAAAPAPPEVVVSDEMARDIHREYAENKGDGSKVCSGRAMIAAVQSELGPQLGMISREECARMLKDAYLEGSALWSADCVQAECDWLQSESRKRLEGGR